MIDKIIKVAEITMWTILSLFLLFVAYIGLSYIASFVDFKPNNVGPTFAIEKTSKESVLQLNPEAIKYVELVVEDLDDTKSLITLKPKKETSKNFTVKVLDQVKNEDWTDEQEGTWKPNKIYAYEVKVSKLSINKYSCNICEDFISDEVLSEENENEE